jgi:hypothetical protein
MSSQGLAATFESPPWIWNIVNWEAGCARRGCFYDFNITALVDGLNPAFSAHCSGDEDRTNQTFFRLCGVNEDGLGNRGVAAKFLPRDDINYGAIKAIAVIFTYTDVSSKT